MDIEKSIINRFERTDNNPNSVIDNEDLQKYSVDSILTDEENRTLWINGMPFGNAYIHFDKTDGVTTVSETQPMHAEIFNDFENNIALGDYSHAEGYNTTAAKACSHTEGGSTTAGGNYSHAEGLGTETTNEAEHASGKYNVSTKDANDENGTIFSVGIGNSDIERKNAIEITNKGDIYIGADSNENNPCGYPGDSKTTLQSLIKNQNLEEITYSDLVEKRNGGNLIPGKFYRITDYITRTIQQNTISGEHQFDIIVLALAKNTLSEDAWAIHHDFDDPESDEAKYFGESKLEAWKLRYCLDNDMGRFSWASPSPYAGYDIYGGNIPTDDDFHPHKLFFNTNYHLPSYFKFNLGYLNTLYVGSYDSLPDEVFADCFNLKTICINSDSVSKTFKGCRDLETIYCTNPSIRFNRAMAPFNSYNVDTVHIFLNTFDFLNTTELYAVRETQPNAPVSYYLFGTEREEKSVYLWLNTTYINFKTATTFLNNIFGQDDKNIFELREFTDRDWIVTDDNNNLIAPPNAFLELNEDIINYINEINIPVVAMNKSEYGQPGKGVIYRMIDEFGNDCPYDFKNILFDSKFTFHDINSSNNVDISLSGNYTDNKIQNNTGDLNKNYIYGSGNVSTDCLDIVICGNDNSLKNCDIIKINGNLNYLTRCSSITMNNGANYNNILTICSNLTCSGSNSNNVIYFADDITENNLQNQFIFNGNILANNVYQSNQ